MTGTQTIGEPTALSGDQTTGLRSGEASDPIPDVQPDGSTGTDEPKLPSGPPRLSPWMATLIVNRSPLHAYTEHRDLNPNWKPKPDEQRFDVGNVVHQIIISGGTLEDVVFCVHADDWRTKEAKETRDYARELGKIPLLAKQRDEVAAMVEAVRAQLAAHGADPEPFTDGAGEHTVEWDEDGVACKGRIDWLRHDLLVVDDLKTRSQAGGARPDSWKRALYSTGAHIQAYAYTRAVEIHTGRPAPRFRWVLAETAPPFAVSVVEPDGSVLACGQADWEWALRVWRECLASGVWPGYPAEVQRVEAPSWELERRAWREEEAA